jgi:hypothetical protein
LSDTATVRDHLAFKIAQLRAHCQRVLGEGRFATVYSLLAADDESTASGGAEGKPAAPAQGAADSRSPVAPPATDAEAAEALAAAGPDVLARIQMLLRYEDEYRSQVPPAAAGEGAAGDREWGREGLSHEAPPSTGASGLRAAAATRSPALRPAVGRESSASAAASLQLSPGGGSAIASGGALPPDLDLSRAITR